MIVDWCVLVGVLGYCYYVIIVFFVVIEFVVCVVVFGGFVDVFW